MAEQHPSFYPKPETYQAISPPPSKQHSESPAISGTVPGTQEILPSDYEVVLEMQARLTQKPTMVGSTKLSKPVDGTLRIIQGPLPPSTPEQSQQDSSFHAFLSIGDINLPLLPRCVASRAHKKSAFTLVLPAGTFVVEPHRKTEAEIVDGFERICRWFCCWEVDQTEATTSSTYATVVNEPVGISSYPPPPSGALETVPENTLVVDTSCPNKSVERIARMGDKGVLLVEKVGDALHKKLTNTLEKRRDAIPEDGRKNVKLGGRATASVLTTTRKIVGTGAQVASKITDRLSSSVGSVVAQNKVSRSMANAPEGSAKRTLYDNLMAGMMVIGKVYVAADEKGKIIINDVTELSSDISRRKYGDEAGHAARSLGGIILDGYRISRFPQKLGARSLLTSAAKSSMKKAHGARPSSVPAIGNAPTQATDKRNRI